MATVQVRVTDKTRDALQQLADERGQSVSGVIDALLRRDEEDRFWADFHAQLDVIRADEAGWTEMRSEMAELDGTLGDGLAEEGTPGTDPR